MSEVINLDSLDEELEYSTEVQDEGLGEKPTDAFMEIQGLTLESQVEFLVSRVSKGEDLLPLCINYEGSLKGIGNFSVNLDNILLCKFLGYQLYLHTPDGKKIDLADHSTLYHFIRL